MPQATTLNSLLGDAPLKGASKKTGAADLLGAKGQSDIFSKLLSGLTMARGANQATSILGASATAAKKTATATLDLQSLQLTPELAAALKNLKAEDLQSLPPEIAGVLAQHLNAQGTLDDKTVSILDALSSGGTLDGTTPDLVTLVSDPELAAILQGLSAKLAAVKNADPSVAAPFASLLPNSITTTITAPTAGADGKPTETALTVTIADLDAEGFQALKKLAFADIAPYLTQPRVVHASGNTVMKVAQGPSFLSDDMSNSTLLTAMTGLAPALQTAVEGAAVETPAFINPVLLAKAAAAAAQGQTNIAPVTPQQQPFSRAHLMAALLGVANQQANAAQQTAAPQQTQTADAAPAPQAQINPMLVAAQTTAQNTGATPTITATQIAAAFAQPQAARGVNGELKGLDTTTDSFDNALDFGAVDGFDSALRIHADQTQGTNASTSLISARGAGQPHPSTQMVSIAMQRGMEGAFAGAADKQFTIQLDPANLGRVKITLQFGEDNTVKAKLLAERPETVALLQKDAVALERALHNSGFNVGNDSLTFDLGQNGNFEGAMSQNGNSNQHGGKQGSDEDGTELATIETILPVFVDPATGLTHVNIVI